MPLQALIGIGGVNRWRECLPGRSGTPPWFRRAHAYKSGSQSRLVVMQVTAMPAGGGKH